MNSQPSIGYISILLVVFGRQLCLPLPADVLLVAAGALVTRMPSRYRDCAVAT